jgi:hypothetical protein
MGTDSRITAGTSFGSPWPPLAVEGVNPHKSTPKDVRPRKGQRRQKETYMIIAIDFDGVLVKDKFPEIGEPDWDIISAVWRLGFTNHELILWTSRVDDRLQEAIEWCKAHDLKFTCVNSNTPSNLAEYGTDPRKAFADVYIDDRACGYSRTQTLIYLNKLITKEEHPNNER